jgi:hypothetical protein
MTQVVIPNFGTTMDDMLLALERRFEIKDRTSEITEDDHEFVRSYFPKYESGSQRINVKEKAFIQNRTTGDTGAVYDWDTQRVCEPTICLDVRDRRTIDDIISVVADTKAADILGKYIDDMRKAIKKTKVDFRDIAYLVGTTYPLVFKTKAKTDPERMQREFNDKLEKMVMQEGLKIYSQLVQKTVSSVEKPKRASSVSIARQKAVVMAR